MDCHTLKPVSTPYTRCFAHSLNDPDQPLPAHRPLARDQGATYAELETLRQSLTVISDTVLSSFV